MIPARTITVIAVLCSLVLPVTVSARAPQDSLADWIAQVAARNAIAHDVAAYKFPAGRPIEDPRREAAVLADKRARALQMGLDPDSVVATYRQLIEANKLLQHIDLHRFLLGTQVPPAPPLEVIRDRIDVLDARLLAQWASLDDVRAAPDCPRRLAQAIARQAAEAAKNEQDSRNALVLATVGFCADEARARSAPTGG